MPNYDLSCVVVRDGKKLRGNGVSLPRSIGDQLVKRRQAKLSAVQQPEPPAPPKPEEPAATAQAAQAAPAATQEPPAPTPDAAKDAGVNAASGAQGAQKYAPKHMGGGHYNVIDVETGEEMLESNVSKEEAQSCADDLNSGNAVAEQATE